MIALKHLNQAAALSGLYGLCLMLSNIDRIPPL